MSEWRKICALDEIARPGARIVPTEHGNIGLFRNEDNEVYALFDQCPHRGAPLTKGRVSGRHVECPRHDWMISLVDGCADQGGYSCAKTYAVKVEQGSVFIEY
jgi:nitrite reductase (NADH) small subunit